MARDGTERVKVGGCEAYQTFTHTPSVTRSILEYIRVHRGILEIWRYIEVYWGYTRVYRSTLKFTGYTRV